MPTDEPSSPPPSETRRVTAASGGRDGDTVDSLIGRVLDARFEVVGSLGRGGAGDVYRAVQRALGREVALKVLRNDLDAQARAQFEQRFLREAALAGRLKHPNVVTVHDFGVDGGIHYVVMELLDGRTLSSALRSGPMPPEEAVRIALGVARGLRHAHEQGLVHRDIKPNNVMLVRDDDGREQPKLMDFGLVKSVLTDEDAMTQVGAYMGTPAFMAPEQAKGGAIDGRADLYSLGVMLFRMLAGALPFDADNPLGMALQHSMEPIPSIAKVALNRSMITGRPPPVVPADLEALVRKAMAKDPAERWQDAASFADALETWLNRRLQARAEAPSFQATTLGVAGPSLSLPPADSAPTMADGGISLASMNAPPLAEESVLVPGAGRAEQRPRWGLVALLVTAVSVVVGLLLVTVGVGGVAIGWWSGRAGPGGQPVEIPAPEVPALVAPAPEPLPPAVEPAPAPAPAPSPESTPGPAPAPATRPAPAPAPAPAPRPVPAPRPEPAPGPTAPPGGLVVDEVPMTRAEADALVRFVNGANPDELAAAGVYDKGVGVILKGRPFASAEAFGATVGIGTKTVQACLDAARTK